MPATRDTILFLDSTPTGPGALFFERATDIGLVPILVSKRPEQHTYLSRFERMQVRRMDLAGVLAAIDQYGRERVAGVCSSMSQHAELMVRVAQAIDRPHADPAAVAVCRDKFLTREALADAGIRDVGFETARSGPEAAQAARRLGGTVIVKPRLSSGAFGVRICRSPSEASEHVETLAKELPDVGTIGVAIEEYIEGPQFGVEVFDTKAIGVRHKHVSRPPASITIGADFPALDDPAICSAIAAHAEHATAAVGYTRGPAHVELRYGARGPCIIEINPRLVGAMGPENVMRAYGIDLVEATIRFSCGMAYDLSKRKERASSFRHLLRDGPSVSAIAGREDALRVPGVVHVGLFPNWFSRSGPSRDYQDRVAYVISEADTPAEAAASAEEGLSRLRIVPDAAWRNRLNGIKRLVWAEL